MKPRKVNVTVRDPICFEAVQCFIAELSRRTHLNPTIREAEADIVWASGTDERILSIEWYEAKTPPGHDLADWESESPEWNGDLESPGGDREQLHYAATLEALARNPEAARALLNQLSTKRDQREREAAPDSLASGLPVAKC